MTKISLEYNGNLRCKLVHQKSSEKIITDAPKDNHGKGEMFSPTDLVAGALASCIVTVLGIKNESLNLGIIDMQANVEKMMKSNPRCIGKIEIYLEIKLKEITKNRKESIINIAKNCPVALSLKDSLEQMIHFSFIH